MNRGAALTQAVLIGVALVVMAAGVAGLPRVRPDTIQIALHHDGAPMKAVPVWLASEPQGNPHSMSLDMQRLLTVCVGGALAGLHYALSEVFRESGEAAQAPETGFSGSSNP